MPPQPASVRTLTHAWTRTHCRTRTQTQCARTTAHAHKRTQCARTRTHARMHACMHARLRTRTRTRTHPVRTHILTRTRTHEVRTRTHTHTRARTNTITCALTHTDAGMSPHACVRARPFTTIPHPQTLPLRTLPRPIPAPSEWAALGGAARAPRPSKLSAPRAPCPVAPRAASVLAGSHCPSHDAVNAVTRPALTSHGAVTNRDQGLAARVTAPDLVFYRSRSRAATLAAPNTCALNRAGGPPGADAPHGTNTRTDTRTRRRRPERRRRCRRRPSGALHGAGRGASAARPAPSPAILPAAAGPHTLCVGLHARTLTHAHTNRRAGSRVRARKVSCQAECRMQTRARARVGPGSGPQRCQLPGPSSL